MIETVYKKVVGAPRLALLADLHGRPFRNIIDSVASHRPDLICIPGDIVYGRRPQDNGSLFDAQKNVLPFLEACSSLAPTYLSLGNHECILSEEELDRITDTGVILLDNSWVEKDGLVIGGLTSGYVTDARRFRAASEDFFPERKNLFRRSGCSAASDRKPDTEWLSAFAGRDGYHLLLCHHPEYFPEIPESIQIVLSGHSHNGQIAYYSFHKRRWTGLWAPGQGWLPKYSRGVYENGRLVVSAGLANTVGIPRLFNPTETCFLEPE